MNGLVRGGVHEATPAGFCDAANELFASSSRGALLEVAQDVLFRAVFDAADGEPIEYTVEQAAALDARYPRGGILVRMLSGDHAVSGGWAEEIPLFGLESVDEGRSAPAMDRWLGEERWTDEGAVDFIAAGLAILTSDWHTQTVEMKEGDELLEFWAGVDHYAGDVSASATPMATGARLLAPLSDRLEVCSRRY